MSGPDNYKEFDSSSIVSRDTVSVGKVTLKKREAFLAVIALIALIIVIILAIVLAVEVGGRSTSCSSISSTMSDTASPHTADENLCTTPPCLKTAYYEKSIMNESINPCVDFYQFACGGYDEIYPSNQLISDQRPANQIRQDNVQKLLYLLYFQPERQEEHSYERKLRHFMQSCTDHFDKMELRGKPLIEKVIKPFGGWYVLGQWNASSFDFHKQLKIVHSDFWTTAFFEISIATDQKDWNKKVLQFDFGGLGLGVGSNAFMYNDQDALQIYKHYVMRLAVLLTIDAGARMDTTKIFQFVDDVLEVETTIAQVFQELPFQFDAHEHANRMTLGSLNTLTENTVDFVDFFKYTFPSVSAKFSDQTTVAVLSQGFFHKLGPLLKNYTSTDDGKRKLHNYLVWQLINRYAPELSWDYVHVKRQLEYYVYGYKDDTSGSGYCFNMAQKAMRDAMGALFVKHYLNQKDKQEAMDMLNLIKDEMVKGLTNLPWMTSDNRDESIKKINNSLYKIGYPDYMVNDTYMDDLYRKAAINDSDFFGNILSFNGVYKDRFSDIIAKPDSKTLWVYPIMDPVVEYYNPWMELMATAAILQNPMFAHNGPAYYNFGGIGTVLASNLIHAIDEYGSNSKPDSSNKEDWWTSSTRQRYNDIKDCAIEAQNNKKMDLADTSGSYYFQMNKNKLVASFAPELLSDASGLSLSMKAYKVKMAKGGSEKPPAGLSNYSMEKLFFIAYAQANCQNTPGHLKYLQLYGGTFPGDYKVNLAVSQVKEFRDAFGCGKEDPLAPQKMCQLF